MAAPDPRPVAAPRTVTLTVGAPLDLGLRALQLAPALLGAVLGHGSVSIMLTEVEAYEGVDDPASHAWRGRTPRSAIMFGPPGHVYVYLSHGIHHAMNLVCGPDGTASAVLLRAGRVVAGLAEARQRRPGVADDRLARGPGNLTRALGIDLGDNGATLRVTVGRVNARAGSPRRVDDRDVVAGPRVGVSRAADRPWRFRVRDDATVSAYRRSARAPRDRDIAYPDE